LSYKPLGSIFEDEINMKIFYYSYTYCYYYNFNTKAGKSLSCVAINFEWEKILSKRRRKKLLYRCARKLNEIFSLLSVIIRQFQRHFELFFVIVVDETHNWIRIKSLLLLSYERLYADDVYFVCCWWWTN
jgi:hypothetical protein